VYDRIEEKVSICNQYNNLRHLNKRCITPTFVICTKVGNPQMELAQKKVLTKVEDELLFDSFACSKRALAYVLSSSYWGFSLFSWILQREVKQEILEKICQHM
jgi:hypothetical protein